MEAYAVVLLPDARVELDDKIITVGTAVDSGKLVCAMLRFNGSGALDTTFGADNNGIVFTFVGNGNMTPNAMLLLAGGKILVAGTAVGADNDFALIRFNSDGSLDTTFGADLNGIVLTPVGGGHDSASSVALEADGKIVLAGMSFNADTDFALARYDGDGILDTSFGADGVVITQIGGSEDAQAVAVQADGKIVAAGQSNVNGDLGVTLARYEVAEDEIDETGAPAFCFIGALR